MVSSGLGLFFTTGGKSTEFINQYGDNVILHRDGIYKNDSLFMASIFRGTDFAVLFIIVPIAILILILDIKKNTIKTKLLLISIVAFFLYFSASLAFGVKYNILHLVYMAFFGSSFYTLILGFNLLKNYSINKSKNILTVGLKIFLTLIGLSLFIAWLPDIITSLTNGKSLELIHVYTTIITYVLDMAIISPLVFICMYNLSKKNDIGYILLVLNLTLLIIIGIILPFQTLFQVNAGIELPLEAIITKVGIFVVLAVFAVFYNIKLFKSLNENN